MMFYINCLVITVICVIILDIVKAWEGISSYISYIITKGKSKKSFELKPFSCSTCSQFWCNLLYMIFSNNFTILNLGYIALLTFLTPVIYELLVRLYDILIKIINFKK
jgi:hypothetical protein